MAKKDLTRHYRFLMWGGGIFQIVIGLGLLLLVSFLIGEIMALLYPYLNETVLLVIQIIAWIYLVSGGLLIFLGFLASKLAKYGLNQKPKKEIRFIRIFVIISSILLLIAFPIGTFIGLTLIRESWMLYNDIPTESEEPKSTE